MVWGAVVLIARHRFELIVLVYYLMIRVELSGVGTSSGLRASGSGLMHKEYIKKIVLKDLASNAPWRTKLTTIHDAEDCL